MRSPPLVPAGFDVNVYVVLDDFEKNGRVYREIDEERADRRSIIQDLLSGNSTARRVLLPLTPPKDGRAT
jgi:hypothetical protein